MARTEPELVHNILAGQAVALETLLPAIPRRLSAVVARAMHVDRAQRHASAEAFAQALTPFEVEQPATQHAPARRWLRIAVPALGLVAAAGVLPRVCSGTQETTLDAVRQPDPALPVAGASPPVEQSLPASPEPTGPAADGRELAAAAGSTQGAGGAAAGRRSRSSRGQVSAERARDQAATPARTEQVPPREAPVRKPPVQTLRGF